MQWMVSFFSAIEELFEVTITINKSFSLFVPLGILGVLQFVDDFGCVAKRQNNNKLWTVYKIKRMYGTQKVLSLESWWCGWLTATDVPIKKQSLRKI